MIIQDWQATRKKNWPDIRIFLKKPNQKKLDFFKVQPDLLSGF